MKRKKRVRGEKGGIGVNGHRTKEKFKKSSASLGCVKTKKRNTLGRPKQIR